MACTTASQRVADAATRQNARDDEGGSLNAGLSPESNADDRGRLASRWRTELNKPPRLPGRAVLVSFTLSPVLLRDWKVCTEGQPSDRIAVISSAIAAFTSITNSVTSSQREDLRSVAVLLYSGKTIFLLCDQSSNLSSFFFIQIC
jgi:hypothetical protein